MPQSRRPERTFLIQAGTHRFRVDLKRTKVGFEVSNVVRGQADSASDVDGADHGHFDAFFGDQEPVDAPGLASLLKLRPKPARAITVLSDKVTAVVTDLNTMAGDNWKSAADMEAQTVSGLASSECVSASTRLSADQGMVRAWTIQASIRDLASLRGSLTKTVRGCRLVAVGHPAGIRIASPSAQLECWPEFTLFHAPGGERINLKGWNGPTSLNDAFADPDVAAGLVPVDSPPTVLQAIEQDFNNKDPYNWLDFAEPTTLRTWADALASAINPLNGQISGMPVVSVPKPPPSKAQLAATSGGFATLMLLILGLHYYLNEQNHHQLEEELEHFTKPAEKLAADKKRISDLNSELKELEKQMTSFYKPDEIDIVAHRKRISALLYGISSGAMVQDILVTKIVPDDKLQTVVHGVATNFNAPQVLARKINETLTARGWRANLFRRKAALLRDDSGPWTYEIRLFPDLPVVENSEIPVELPLDKKKAEGELAPARFHLNP